MGLLEHKKTHESLKEKVALSVSLKPFFSYALTRPQFSQREIIVICRLAVMSLVILLAFI